MLELAAAQLTSGRLRDPSLLVLGQEVDAEAVTGALQSQARRRLLQKETTDHVVCPPRAATTTPCTCPTAKGSLIAPCTTHGAGFWAVIDLGWSLTVHVVHSEHDESDSTSCTAVRTPLSPAAWLVAAGDAAARPPYAAEQELSDAVHAQHPVPAEV